MSSWKFHIVTFGCKVNQYESQALREAWLKLGAEECACPTEADVICINSCAITSRGERDARNAVFRLRRDAPQARLILTGCATQLFAAFSPRPDAPYAQPDILVPQKDKSQLLHSPWYEPETNRATDRTWPPFEISRFHRARPILKIQDGCAHRCTYCIVPLTRGRPRSRHPREIADEARRLLDAGFAEIMISGINLRQYGRDEPAFGDFWDLLAFLDTELAPDFAGCARLRISSLEPSQLDARGLDILLACRMVCPHLHISLQHASSRVLKRMGRGHYSAAMLEEAVTLLGRHWPQMGLGADILTGFPGESEEDVDILLDLIHRLPMTYAHVFPYSCRPGTAASTFDGQIPRSLKLERASRIRAAVAERQSIFWRQQTSLPEMIVVADLHQDDPPPLDEDNQKARYKGVNQYYVPCYFDAPAGQSLSGLLRVKPLGLARDGLMVGLLPLSPKQAER